MGTPLLRARGLAWKAHGEPILGPLELEVASGECVAVVGPNGAGKTTLLRLLSGVLQPSAGQLFYGEQPFTALSRRQLARRIAYVPQIRPARVPLTVEEVVLSGRYPHLSAWQLAPTARDFAAVAAASARVGLDYLAERVFDELSGGERQSVYIAAALAQEPEILILDEPTTHLDPRHQRHIAKLMLELNRELKRTVVVATHDLNLASRTAQRVVALNEGRLQAQGPPSEILCPEVLQQVFEAPFEVVRGGERPLSLLRLEP